MTSEDYGWITTEIMTVADSCCCGRVVSVSSLGSSQDKISSQELPKVNCEVKMKIQVEDETKYLSSFDNVKQDDMNIDSFSSYNIQCNERHGCDLTSTSVTSSSSSSSASCAAAAAAHVRRLIDPYGPLTFITPPSFSLPLSSSNTSSSSSSNCAITSALASASAQPSYSLHTVNLYQSFPSSGNVATNGIYPSSSSSSSSSLSPPPIPLSLSNNYSSNTDVSHPSSPNAKKNNLIINVSSTSTLHSSLIRPEPSSCPSSSASSSASSSLSALVPELLSITESVIPISSLPHYSILSPSHNEVAPSRILSFHPSYNRNNSTLLRHSISSDDNYKEKEKNKHDLLKNEIQSLEMKSKEEKELKLQNKMSNHFNNKNSSMHEIL